MLLGSAVLLVILGGVAMTVPPEREPNNLLENRFGDVSWNHELHARMKEIANCTVCHHTEQPGAMDLKPCSTCHKPLPNAEALITPELFMAVAEVKYEGENGPPPMTSAHSSCMGCHKAMNEGPVLCRDCHAQSFSGPQGVVSWDHTLHSRTLEMDEEQMFEDDCVVCHHQDTDAQTEADYRACGSCHKPVVEKGLSTTTDIKDHQDYTHGQCKDCHVEFNPEDENVPCTDCHQGMVVNLSLTNPSLEEAVHHRCRTCHNVDEAAFAEGQPGICVDCHDPDPSRIEIPNVGTIAWDHVRHGEFGDIECQTCHHTEAENAPMIACGSCHGEQADVELDLEQSLEQTCLECHQKEKVGLTSLASMLIDDQSGGYYQFQSDQGAFWWDHRFHAVDASLSCRNCHHNTIKQGDQYLTAVKTGQDWTEQAGHIQNCANCHGEYGPVAGSVAEATEAPAFPDAYQVICTECHQKLEAGPQAWNEYFEQD